jgi:putative glutamine amidotransferase
VIEAVEQPGERFVVGVQWHPEVRAEDETTIRLFKSFVEAAAKFDSARS